MRELIKQERLKDQVRFVRSSIVPHLLLCFYILFATRAINQEKKHRSEEGQEGRKSSDKKKERVITIRPLNMEDFREAKNQVNMILLTFAVK